MPVIEETIVIKGDGARVYQLVKDIERYPQFIPDVKAVRILSADQAARITKWHTIIDGVEFRWLERDELDDANWMVKYRLLEGDLEKFEGEWRVKAENDHTVVTLFLDYELGIPAFEEVMGPLLFEKALMNARNLLQGIKREAEKQG